MVDGISTPLDVHQTLIHQDGLQEPPRLRMPHTLTLHSYLSACTASVISYRTLITRAFRAIQPSRKTLDFLTS